MHDAIVFGFGARERDNVLILTPPSDKIITNQLVLGNRFLISTIA